MSFLITRASSRWIRGLKVVPAGAEAAEAGAAVSAAAASASPATSRVRTPGNRGLRSERAANVPGVLSGSHRVTSGAVAAYHTR